jgi:hypothetical protein
MSKESINNPKKRSHSRNFYTFAASLAHCSTELLAQSSFLDDHYQDCLFSLKTQKKYIHNPGNKFILKSINKFLCLNNIKPLTNININKLHDFLEYPHHASTNFSEEEIAALLVWAAQEWLSLIKNQQFSSLTAHDFHDQLSHIARASHGKSFIFNIINNNKKAEFLIKQASLFSAHRLSKKSWQINNGVCSELKYYHAALLSHDDKQIDILYWIKNTEGEFITSAIPTPFICVSDSLRTWASSYEGPSQFVVQEIIKLYFDSLGVL